MSSLEHRLPESSEAAGLSFGSRGRSIDGLERVHLTPLIECNPGYVYDGARKND